MFFAKYAAPLQRNCISDAKTFSRYRNFTDLSPCQFWYGWGNGQKMFDFLLEVCVQKHLDYSEGECGSVLLCMCIQLCLCAARCHYLIMLNLKLPSNFVFFAPKGGIINQSRRKLVYKHRLWVYSRWPYLAMISQGDRYSSPQSSKFSQICSSLPNWGDSIYGLRWGKIWHCSVHHGSNLSCQIWP